VSERRPLNNTAIVVLGMVGADRRNGYEIGRSVERSTRYFWPASVGGIYPELRRLEDAGLLQGRDDPTGDRARRAYELTALGRAALQDWLLDETVGRVDFRHEDLLRLFLATDLPSESIAALLDRIADGHDMRRRDLEANPRPADTPGAVNRTLVLDYGIALNQAAATWCRAAASRLRQEREPDDHQGSGHRVPRPVS